MLRGVQVLWSGHEFGACDFGSPCVTLKVSVLYILATVSLYLILLHNYFKILQGIQELWSEHDFRASDIGIPSVTLTLKVRVTICSDHHVNMPNTSTMFKTFCNGFKSYRADTILRRTNVAITTCQLSGI